jgi:hypothetical protein
MSHDAETKQSVMYLVEYQKDMNAMMDKIRPLRKSLSVLKAEMGK